MRRLIARITIGLIIMLLVMAANILWQNIHCGVPVRSADPLQVIPCEPVEKIESDMEYLRSKAFEQPCLDEAKVH